ASLPGPSNELEGSALLVNRAHTVPATVSSRFFARWQVAGPNGGEDGSIVVQARSWYDAACQSKFGDQLMTAAVQQLLNAFDSLPEADKHQAAVEILRRVSPSAEGDLPESALVEAAEELFLALDAEEARNAQR